MKYIRKFENFDTDGNRADAQSYPKFNQTINLKAKEYVDHILNKGSGLEVTQLCKEIGCDLPNQDEDLDSIREMAVKYFIENPERIKDFEVSFKQFPYGGSDGVVRTNNVGGTSFTNSSHVGESKSYVEDGWVKLELKDDEMNLFSSEATLQNLIRNNKISLHDNEVWFKEGDDSTKKILDVYLEIDEESVNEGLATFLLSSFVAYKLLKWIHKILSRRKRNQFLKRLKNIIDILSKSFMMDKDGLKNALSVSEFSDRFYIRGINDTKPILLPNWSVTSEMPAEVNLPDIRLLKNEKVLIFDDFKIELTDEEYQDFLEIVSKK
jgi:hypothetical protein